MQNIDEKDEQKSPDKGSEHPDSQMISQEQNSDKQIGNEEQQDGQVKVPDIPDTIPVLPLKNTVAFPFALLPLQVKQESSLKLIDQVMRGSRIIGLAAQKYEEADHLDPASIYEVGTLGQIVRMMRVPDGGIQILVQGLERIKIDEFTICDPYFVAKAHAIPEQVEHDLEIEALQRNVLALFQQMIGLTQNTQTEFTLSNLDLDDPRQLVYFIATYLQANVEFRQDLLETNSIRAKLQKLNDYLTHEIEVLELGRKIRSQAQEEMGRAQREYFLREQLKAIQKELGEENEETATVQQLQEKIHQAHLPQEALAEAQRELSRLEKLPAASPEYSVIRTYLDLLASLPWDKTTGIEIDVNKAREILDADHYDLEKIKDRILEYLAVRKLREDRQKEIQTTEDRVVSREPILCFVGPPGVGKTSLGHSIAKALGRVFVRMSLGGIRDEAEIRGHRRTYIGAMPGRIIQEIRRAGTRDPVIILDEVDKVGSDWRGDPTSALLEVLDPEQNSTFRDNYLDLPFDLSQVMFITTANALEPIPAPLRDRMEIVELSGYTVDQKLHIARNFLIPKQIKANGLRPDEVEIDNDALRLMIESYTREAGVRTLERTIASALRKAAKQIAEGDQGPITIPKQEVKSFLGNPPFHSEGKERIDRPGIATGMAWTPVGGEIMYIEAAMMPSSANQLILTGQLGDVMKESAMAALSYIRSNAQALGIEPKVFDNKNIHIHVPAGAVPKDGPSAEITIAAAIASLATGRKVSSDVAMTGEISLRGKVLPIGGIKEKTLAASQAGIKVIILPSRNEPDLEDLPQELREKLSFALVDDVTEVLNAALETTPTELVPQL